MADPDQSWILGELIRYLEHPRSGAMAFEDIGSSWTMVRDTVRSGRLRPGDKGAAEVISRFDALIRFVGLKLGRRLGTDVQRVLSRKELADPAIRAHALLDSLVGSGALSGAIRIPDTAAALHVSADLRANQISCYCEIDAPRQGRNKTKVNWLVRHLKTLQKHCASRLSRSTSAAALRSFSAMSE